MKDSKIDSILDNHMNDYDLQSEFLKAKELLGEVFLQKLSEIYGEGLQEKIMEAISLLKRHKNVKPRELKLYKKCLLDSFITKPDLDVFSREIYVDTYMFCQTLENCDSENYEEEITKKTIIWYEKYKNDNPDDDIYQVYDVAAQAIKNQVYTSVLENAYQNKKKFTL